MAESSAPQPDNKIQSRAVTAGVDLAALPKHVAIIMDGNGRWASGHGVMRLVGHRQGYKTLKRVLLDASDLGIEYLTVYGFSAENWRRPEEEVSGLMRLIEEAARNELNDLIEKNVRVFVAGDLEAVPPTLRSALCDLIANTAENTGITFTLAINYGGRAEIVDAVRTLLRDGADPDKIDEDALTKRMYCPSLPDPDLMIRTAGEMRWSNFLIWQAAYAELFVTDVSWPDFGLDDLIEAVLAFQERDRKFGALSS